MPCRGGRGRPAIPLSAGRLRGGAPLTKTPSRPKRPGRLNSAWLVFLAAPFVLPGPIRWPCLAVAATIGGGTLYALDHLHRSRTLPAVHGLCVTWTAALAFPAVDPGLDIDFVSVEVDVAIPAGVGVLSASLVAPTGQTLNPSVADTRLTVTPTAIEVEFPNVHPKHVAQVLRRQAGLKKFSVAVADDDEHGVYAIYVGGDGLVGEVEMMPEPNEPDDALMALTDE